MFPRSGDGTGYGIIFLRTAAIVALIAAVLIPALLYRLSRSWWLMNYYMS